MLPRQHRITQPRDFARLYRTGKRYRNRFATLFFLRSDERVRAGFVVSAKVAKKSTERNRIKRILRGHFRTLLTALPRGDYLFVAAPAMRSARAEVIRDTLTTLLSPLTTRQRI